MHSRHPVPWDELRKARNLIDTVLRESLHTLDNETDETLEGWRDNLVSYWSAFRVDWAPNLVDTLRTELTSKFKLAQLLLATYFHDKRDPLQSSRISFSPTEMSLLRDSERYGALDVLTEEQIVQGILNHQQGLFELASDFYHKQYHHLDSAMTGPGDFQPDLIHAFYKKYGERFEKVKGALAKIDTEHLDGILSLTPEKIEALSTLSIETLIAISGPIQSKLLKDLAIAEKLRDAEPEQIVAIGALNNPAFAKAYTDTLIALARNGDIELYERLISELKEGSKLTRDENQRNMKMLAEMFDKALDSIRDTVVALTSIDRVAAEITADRPDLRRHTYIDGTVTILFSDIEGSTEMTQRLGDQVAQEVLRSHNAIVRQQVAIFGGFEVKSLGDGFMLVFSYARNAIRCAIAVQQALTQYNEEHPDEPVRVRIGLHTGEPIKEADDFFGQSVIMAARIASHAQGDEILVSALVKELTESRGDIAFGQAREVELKGLAGVNRVYSVVWE